jgi:diguanylate cyclase (GGDEF)-like protein
VAAKPAAEAPVASRGRRPLPAAAQLLLLALALVTAAAFAVALTLEVSAPAGWGSFGLLAAFVLASDRLELHAGLFYDMRVATVAMVAAALLLRPAAVMLCGACFALHRLGQGLLLHQRLFRGCNHALGGLAAWGVARLVLDSGRTSAAAIAVAGVAATVAYVLCTWSLLVAILHFARDLALAEMRRQLPALLVAEVGLGALGTVVAYLWTTAPVLVPFAIVPLVLVWTALRISTLREQANVDVKTGLFNARHLREALSAEIDRAARYGRPLTLLVADLDFLREVNNAHGHLAGDVVLAEIGDLLRAELRSTDVAARFGGEEFCVILPETPPQRAHVLAERIRRRVAGHEFECGREGAPVRVTVSVGIASFPADARTDEELIAAADEALYAAKSRGRNRVCVVGEPPLAAVGAR